MNENTQNNTPASGEEQMHNQTVEIADSTPNHNQAEQETVEPNPAKRVPYDGTRKLPRTKAENMATINTCNGQIGRVDLRAAFLMRTHNASKSEFSASSDFEAKREIVLADKTIVSELTDLKSYKNELRSQKTELLKAAESEVNAYSFDELTWQ